MKDLTVIIPCLREDEKLVTELYNKLCWLGCTVIIVNDGDYMDLDDDVRSISYYPNMGYGYAIKKGISQTTTPISCTIDGDGQHLIEDIQMLYNAYKMVKDCKMIIGRRWNLNERGLRYWGRKGLNFLATVIANHYMVDLNSGIRVFDTQLAKGYSPILCDTFSFTTSFTMAMITDKHKVEWLSVDVQPRTYGKSRVRVVQDGFVTLYYILWVGLALRTRNIRAWLRKRILGR